MITENIYWKTGTKTTGTDNRRCDQPSKREKQVFFCFNRNIFIDKAPFGEIKIKKEDRFSLPYFFTSKSCLPTLIERKGGKQ